MKVSVRDRSQVWTSSGTNELRKDSRLIGQRKRSSRGVDSDNERKKRRFYVLKKEFFVRKKSFLTRWNVRSLHVKTLFFPLLVCPQGAQGVKVISRNKINKTMPPTFHLFKMNREPAV